MGLLDGKVCVITGGAGSVGLSSARAMLAEGAKVMLVDLDADALRLVEADLADGHPGRIATVAADVSDPARTHAYVEAVLERWGRIDVLFCNAGISGAISPITDYPEDLFSRVMAINVGGVFLACKHALPHMGAGGSVVITSSVVGVTADPGICAYATSKHALIGFMRVAAKECAPRNIRVNVIAPGPIDNGFQSNIEDRLSGIVGRDATEMLDEKIPLGRHGGADEIARMVLFLASDQSSFSTGGVFMADGGMHI